MTGEFLHLIKLLNGRIFMKNAHGLVFTASSSIHCVALSKF